MIFINKIREILDKNYKTNERFENYVKNILISFFIKLNKEDINILLIMSLLLINIITNKYSIKIEYWYSNHNDIISIMLLLLPFINNNKYSELEYLHQILYNDKNTNIIPSYIFDLNRNLIIKDKFKFSTMLLGLLNSNEDTVLNDAEFTNLIYKIMYYNFIGLLHTLYIINGKSYVNWVNIIPLDINTYNDTLLFKSTLNKITEINETINTNYKTIIINNLLNYNGLWLGDIYNILRINYYDNFKKLSWLIEPINNNEYVINKLNVIFNLDKILNLDYYNYNDLNTGEQILFNKILNNLTPLYEVNILLEKFYESLDSRNDLKKKYYQKNKFNTHDKYETSFFIKDIIKMNKIDILWNFLQKIILEFKKSAYSKFLIINNKIVSNYYYKPINNNIILLNSSLNLYLIYKIIELLMSYKYNNNIILYDQNYISLNNKNQKEFLNRLFNTNYPRDTWLHIPADLINDLNILLIYVSFQELVIYLVFEELIMTGVLSKFVENNNEYNNNAYYYITNDQFKNLSNKNYLKSIELKQYTWINYYAVNWITQINFFHHYIHNRIMYITGATGIGKTTQIPKLLLYASKAIDYNQNTKLICTQPRIGPVVENATRVAEELGVPIINKETGLKINNYYIQYKYKNDNHMNKSEYYIRYITDGSIINEILNNPTLFKKNNNVLTNNLLYDIIIIDEAHEHSIIMDLLILLLRNSIYINNKIKFIITSATMDIDEPIYRRYFQCINDNLSYPIKNYYLDPFNNKYILLLSQYIDRRIHISEPNKQTRFEIQDIYLNENISRIEAEKLAEKTVIDIVNKTNKGGILLFSYGENEIFNIIKSLNSKMPSNCIALPLYSNLHKKYRDIISNINITLTNIRYKRQDIYYLWHNKYHNKTDTIAGLYNRFIIVATNIAEASITIPDLKYVIDLGYTKTQIYNYKLNISQMKITDISEINRIQRRGRVGRIDNGIVYYMYKYKSKENIEVNYNIKTQNIDIHILLLLAVMNSQYIFHKNIDINLYLSYQNILNYEKTDIVKILQENYIINNTLLNENYFNNWNINYDIFYIYEDLYNLETIKDKNGQLFLIHPLDNNNRNILNNLIKPLIFDNMNIIINYLIENKLIDNNYKSKLGHNIIKNIEENDNINILLLNHYSKIYKCHNNIHEINIFLKTINYSLLELINTNIIWDDFKLIYNNYTSDILFIYEIIQKIKFIINNILNETILINNINKYIDIIIQNYNTSNLQDIDTDLINILNSLKNMGELNKKNKIVIYNYLIKNFIYKYIHNPDIYNQIFNWTQLNKFNNSKIISFIEHLITYYYQIIDNKIIYTKPIIYSLNNIDTILECFYNSYKNNIAYPSKNKNIHNNNIIIAKSTNRLITELVTVANICYFKQNYLYFDVTDNDILNISLLF
uniref:Helicase ATP-binding domain-containing protein n=1 Tax=viral metagenome TaxID=1070528 RepID=A0A6C0H7C3_9ZZZZ